MNIYNFAECIRLVSESRLRFKEEMIVIKNKRHITINRIMNEVMLYEV